jgi:hypothetical protein
MDKSCNIRLHLITKYWSTNSKNYTTFFSQAKQTVSGFSAAYVTFLKRVTIDPRSKSSHLMSLEEMNGFWFAPLVSVVWKGRKSQRVCTSFATVLLRICWKMGRKSKVKAYPF